MDHDLPPPDRPCVQVTAGPGIAAALPQLLGFAPEESLVVVALGGDRRVGLTLRVDLPPPGHERALAGELVDALRPGRPTAAVVLVVTEDPDEPWPVLQGSTLPRLALLHEVTAALVRAGIRVTETLLVRGGRCWDYDDPADGAGRTLPTGTSALAAASAYAGQVTAPDRAALVARTARVSGPAAAAAARVCARIGAGHAARLSQVGWEQWAEESWASVLTALELCRPGSRTQPDDEALARVAWAVGDTELRGRALTLGLGEDAAAAETLWTEVLRRVPAPLDVAPATLLAVTAWSRGDGTTASIALDRALDGQPGHPFALTLRAALAAALPPHDLRRFLAGLDATDHRPVAEGRRAG